jgi:hypothetical protein
MVCYQSCQQLWHCAQLDRVTVTLCPDSGSGETSFDPLNLPMGFTNALMRCMIWPRLWLADFIMPTAATRKTKTILDFRVIAYGLPELYYCSSRLQQPSVHHLHHPHWHCISDISHWKAHSLKQPVQICCLVFKHSSSNTSTFFLCGEYLPSVATMSFPK